MNTTTCAHCGNDYPDREMFPLEEGGELCIPCMEDLRHAAPVMLAALQRIQTWLIAPALDAASLGYVDSIVNAAIAKAEGKQ